MEEDSFYKWTQELTRGSNLSFQKVSLTETHLSPLLKSKGFNLVAKQLIHHVRSANECQQIRLNLRHSSLRKDARAGKYTNQIQKTCAHLQTSIKDAKKEIASETQDLKRLVEKEEELNNEEEYLLRQIALLDVAVEDRENRTKRLNQWTKDADNLLPHFASSSSLEDAIKQEVASEELKIIITKLRLLKLFFLPNEEQNVNEDELEVWRLIDSLLEKHKPLSLMRAISLVTLKETSALNSSIQGIDLISDAKALRLKYGHGGGLVDELCPEQLLETVESLLIEMSGKHIEGHFKNQRKVLEIQTAVDSLKSFVNQIHSVAEELYSDPSIVSEVIMMCDASLKVAGLKAILVTAPKLLKELKTRASAAAKHWETMTEKTDKIHHFDQLVESTVSDLHFLTLESSQNLEHLKEIKEEIASVVEDGLAALSLPTPFQRMSFRKETEAVLELPIEYISSPAEYGVVPLHSGAPLNKPHSILDGVRNTVPCLTLWDNIIEVIRRKKLHLREDENTLSRKIEDLTALMSTMKANALSTLQVKELCKKSTSQDCILETKILPLLDESEISQAEMEPRLEQLRSSIDEWWNQPGRVIKDYMKHNST